MRKNSIKNIRINEEVMRELSNIIRGEIKDPRINPMTSVVAVEVAPDLKTAKAYISVLGDEKSRITSSLIRIFLILFFLIFYPILVLLPSYKLRPDQG